MPGEAGTDPLAHADAAGQRGICRPSGQGAKATNEIMRLFVAIGRRPRRPGNWRGGGAAAPRLAGPALDRPGRLAPHPGLPRRGGRAVSPGWRRLERAARRHPAVLSLAGAGAFPAPPGPGCCGPAAGRPRDGLLAASAGAGARRAGAPPATSGRRLPAAPHPGPVPGAGRRGPSSATLGGFTGTAWTATEVHLIRSRLGRPRYEASALAAALPAPIRAPLAAPVLAGRDWLGA